MNTTDIATLGLTGLQGLFSGISGANQNKQTQQQLQQQQQQQAQGRLDQIINQLMQFEQGKLDRGRQDAQAFQSALGPLGQEQQYVRNNNIMRAILPQLAGQQANRPTDPAIASAMGQVSNPLGGLLQNGQLRPDIAATFSDNATSRAITDQRKALQMLNPDYEFQPLTDYGLNENADMFNAEVGRAGKLVKDSQQQGYGTIAQLLEQQRQSAQNELAQSQQQAQQQTKETPLWKKLLGPAAGIGASFIPGVGPALAPLIGGAVGGLADGGRGAVLGAGSGGVTGLLKGGFNSPKPGVNPVQAGFEGPGNGGMLGTYESQFPSSLPTLPNSMQYSYGSNPVVGQNPSNVIKAVTNGQATKPRPTMPSGVVGPRPAVSHVVGGQPPNDNGSTYDPSPIQFPVPQSAQGLPTFQRRPDVNSVGRIMDAKVGGGPMKMNYQDQVNFGNAPTSRAAMSAVPVGALAGILGASGAFGTGPLAGAIASSPTAQNMYQNMRGPLGLSPTFDAQRVVSQLMNSMKAYNSQSPSDIAASQDLVRMMQPYLQRIGK